MYLDNVTEDVFYMLISPKLYLLEHIQILIPYKEFMYFVGNISLALELRTVSQNTLKSLQYGSLFKLCMSFPSVKPTLKW